ncbi:MAG: hypothetical protein Q4B70_09820 [Lachnospiraceae bacterium]|nr:hypothetical protein [Lachnospiraceae bacterium]
MFRVWGKIWKSNHMIKDITIENPSADQSRTSKVYAALNDMCLEFDLQVPIWLDSNKKEFIAHDKTRFHQDNFIESIDFDYLEFHVIEEDMF